MKIPSFLLGILVLGLTAVLPACTSDDGPLFATADASATSGSSGGQGSTGSGGTGQGGTGQGGTGQGGTGQGGAGQGGMGQGGGQCAPIIDDCTQCLSTMCTDMFCECFGATDCPGIITCTQSCLPNDPQCLPNCFMANATGLSEFVLMSDCAGTICQASCPGSTPSDACSVCLSTKCEAQLEGCYADPECVTLSGCVQNCPPGNMFCVQQCAMQHQAGVAEFQALTMCSSMSCTGMCP